MTRKQMIENQIVELQKTIELAKAHEEEQNKNWRLNYENNVSRVINEAKRVFPGYTVTGDFSSYYLSDDEPNSNRRIGLKIGLEGDRDWSVSVDVDSEGKIHEFRVAGYSGNGNDVSAAVSRSMLVDKIFQEFRLEHTANIGRAIMNFETYKFEKSPYNSLNDLRTKLHRCETMLKEIDLDINPGSVLEYNDFYFCGGRKYDNWRRVKIISNTPKFVNMIELVQWHLNGKDDFNWTERSKMRKERIISRFRQVND